MNENFKHQIKLNEGFESNIYDDNLGFKTIGYGFYLGALTSDEIALNGGKIEPMSREVADKILDLKLEKLCKEVFSVFCWLSQKSQNVQNVVIEMCYQMGVNRVKKFATTLHHIRSGEYERAYKSGLESLWAKQTPTRAKRVLGALLQTDNG